MRIDIVTLFPELCESFLHASILGRAAARGLFTAHCHQIRDYTHNRQRQTDDYPYGGGCGMVLYAQPVADCLRAVLEQYAEQGLPRPHIVFLTAAGRPYTEEDARRLAAQSGLVLVCGHYEGIDERVIEAFGDEELSIGDYVLTGGELPALVVADSVLRLQPGVLAEERGYQEESYWDDLLEYPQYTRPEVWEGRAVPPVLLTGDHRRIDAWRAGQSKARTRQRRPDLYARWCAAHPYTPQPWKRGESARLARGEQLDAAAALCAAAWPQQGADAAQRRLLEACRRQGWAFYLYTAGGCADGMVGVRATDGGIGALCVRPDARGQGVGGKLMAFALKKLAAGRAAAHAWLRYGDQAAEGFCRRMGFAPTGALRARDDACVLPGQDGPFLAAYAPDSATPRAPE